MRWPPYEHVFFDCDSTLSTIEGIDILADSAGKRWRVEVLTQAAMEGDIDLSEVYDRRLRAVKPTQNQVRQIRQAYKRNLVEDAQETIAALRHLGHRLYIISGGLLEPVREFGVFLGVDPENIRAVGVSYNELSGQWWDNDDQRYLTFEEGALTVSDGKAEIVRELLQGKSGRSLLVGDGTSDLLAGKAVDLFVGYAGVVTRQKVREEAPILITSRSLAPMAAIAAGPAALRTLEGTEFEGLAHKAWNLIQEGALSFNDERQQGKFDAAVDAARAAFYSRTDGSAEGDPGSSDALDDWSQDAGMRGFDS